jgi:hypothetical protein
MWGCGLGIRAEARPGVVLAAAVAAGAAAVLAAVETRVLAAGAVALSRPVPALGLLRARILL